MLEHDAGRIVLNNLADDLRGHLHGQHQRIVLDHERNVAADCFHRLFEVTNDLLVRAQMRRRRDHDRGRAARHDGAGQRPHRGESSAETPTTTGRFIPLMNCAATSTASEPSSF